jgi:hypothetical protein
LRAAGYLLRDELLDHRQGVFEVTHSLPGGCVVARSFGQCDGLLLVGQSVSRGADFVRKGVAGKGQLSFRMG